MSKISSITVVGSGTMGRDIALLFAINGFKVYLTDVNKEVLNQAQSYIELEMIKSVKRGFMMEEELQQSMKRISYLISLKEAAQHADLVIEAVLEKIELKMDIFKQLDEICPQHTILATNTSTMSPTEIAAQTNRSSQCVAMHFFNPAHKMKLIEIVRALDTSDETMKQIKEVVFRLKKEAVEVNEFPGFVTSRMNCLIGNEAMTMLQEGVASAEDIDKALKLGLNHPMGPLELADLVGLDSRLRNMQYLYETLGEKYRPCPLLLKYVKAGRLGKKSGKGFYDYTKIDIKRINENSR